MNRRQVTVTVLAVAGGLLVIIALTAVVVAAFTTASIRSTQTDNTGKIDNAERAASAAEDAAKEAKRTAELLEDCVNPEGKCAQQGQKQTAKAIGDIGQLQVNAVACAFTESSGAEDMPPRELARRITVCLEQLAEPSSSRQ